MKPTKAVVALLVAGFLLPASPVLAQFSGNFSGYYAPANWTVTVYNNPTFDNTAAVVTTGVPNTLEIDGAVDANQQVSVPQPPASIIDFTITLSGTGLVPVQFNYTFTGVNDGYDNAALLYNNGSGLQEVGVTGSFDGSLQTYFNDTTFFGGQTFGFRVYSNNDNIADVLTIIAVPEPSSAALILLGTGALAWKARRRSIKR